MSFLLNCHCNICPSEKERIIVRDTKTKGQFQKQSGRTTQLPTLAAFWFHQQALWIHSVKTKGLL